jgi:hypothetical protein
LAGRGKDYWNRARNFWDKGYAGIHPTSPERFVQMQKTSDEILQKRARNQPLVPEMKQTEGHS